MGASEQQIRPAAPYEAPNEGQSESHPKAVAETIRIITLGSEYIEEVCRLEARSYPAPWSTPLVRGEFEKNVSLRLGLTRNDELIAYSFNYLVVDELHILNVAVAPERRNNGYGRRLLQSV